MKDALKQLELIQMEEGVRKDGGKTTVGEEQQEGVRALMPTEHSSLRSEIDKVMAREEEAMGDLEDNDGNKRVRRTIEASSKEVRSLVKHIENENSGEAMECARVEEGKVVLLIASESSEESGERKRKHREAVKTKAGTVASRLRKKYGGGTVVDRKEEIMKKAVKMVVGNVKVAAKKLSTFLTLAPPTLGLPNE